MNDFDFDAMQKKRIAQGARHKKNGSKSHGCTLPSDLLTEAQKRKLNGPVVTLKLDEPMTWKDFKGLPEDKQRLYLERLKELYQPSCSMLGQMFGVTLASVSRRLGQLGVAPAYSRTSGIRPSETDRAKWDAFCNGVVGGKPGVTQKEAEQPTTIASTQIKDLREKAGLTQAELAERCGMQDSAIRRYESGRGNPTEKTLQRIANGFSSAIAKINTVTEAADDTVEPADDAVETEEPVENAVPVTPSKAEDVREKAIDEMVRRLTGIDDFVDAILDRPKDEPEKERAKPALPSAFRFTLNGVDNWESVFALLRGIPLPEKADVAISVRRGGDSE